MAGAGEFPKVDGDIIYQADYNAIQSVIAGVVSTYYGNAISSSPISGNPEITAAGLDNLRLDINKAYTHITNGNSTITDVAVGDIITNEVWNAYKTAADYCETNKNTVHPSQLAVVNNNNTMAGPWNAIHSHIVNYQFASSEQADYFFNTGGSLVVNVGGFAASVATGSKDQDWLANILDVIPTQTYTRSNWVSGTDINVFEFGNISQYTENYCQILINKLGPTQFRAYVNVFDVDNPVAPRIDENVNVEVSSSMGLFYSTGAITATLPTINVLSNF
jgi:hypothetical protein